MDLASGFEACVRDWSLVLELIAAGLTGVGVGVFTGIVPGIHPNTVIFGSLPLYPESGLDFLVFAAFVTGLSVSHTFHDFLPSIFLGVPEAEVALSSMPGQEMASEGRGVEAFRCTVIGGAASAAAMLGLIPVLALILKPVYSALSSVMHFILVFLLVFLVFRSDKPSSAAVVAALSGVLGLVAFGSSVNEQFVLVPVFAGLFAAPSILSGLKVRSRVSSGEASEPDVEAVSSGFLGAASGLVAGVLPGAGPAVSTSLLLPFVESSSEKFLAAMGGVNTSDILASFLALFLIGRPRSGASVALQSLSQVSKGSILAVVGVSLVCVGCSACVAWYSGPVIEELFFMVDSRLLFGLAALSLVSVTFVLTGPMGVLVLAVSCLIGMAALVSGSRAVCMSVLIVPSILLFSGMQLI